MLETRILINKIKNNLVGVYPKLGFARSGEDFVLEQFFPLHMKGFYVDVGSYHPIAHSNTYRYYLHGWNGINIDPNTDMISRFRKVRKRDISLNLAIGPEKSILEYYCFDADPSLNTISKLRLKEILQSSPSQNYKTRLVEVEPLKNVFKNHLKGGKVDFLSVDVEGVDLDVLKSNDWEEYRPKVVVVELNSSLISVNNNKVCVFMNSKQYQLIAFTPLNLNFGNAFFVDTRSNLYK